MGEQYDSNRGLPPWLVGTKHWLTFDPANRIVRDNEHGLVGEPFLLQRSELNLESKLQAEEDRRTT
jgi:hypothetical protein